MSIFKSKLCKENESLRKELDYLRGKMRIIYDANLMSYERKVLIAGKSEGFNFKDADFYVVDNDKELFTMQQRLRQMNYAVILTTAIIDRDDVLRR